MRKCEIIDLRSTYFLCVVFFSVRVGKKPLGYRNVDVYL